jgi:hypothetical protein
MHPIVKHGGHRFRRHVRELWASRGGGFYGFVATLTFVYLEAVDLVGDVFALRHAQLSLGGVISWFVQNAVDAFLNVLWSAIWPVKWLGLFGVGLTSGALLAGSYVTYRALRPTVLRLLREPGEEGDIDLTPAAGGGARRGRIRP